MMLATQPDCARVDTRAHRPHADMSAMIIAPPQRFSWDRKDQEMIEGVLEDVAVNFSQPLTLREIGAARGYSVYQIIRTFRRLLGTTPHAYIMKMRLGYAVERLIQGDTRAGAAADAGFSDQSHMTRHFKRIFGATPLQYFRAIAPS